MVSRTYMRATRTLARTVTLGVVAAAVLMASAAHGGATPAQQCQAAKNKTAGKYAACRQSAEAKLATSGDTSKYNDALDKCEDKFKSAWQKAIAKAAAKGATCPDAPLGESDFQTVIDEHTDNVATALGGGGLSTELLQCQGDLAAYLASTLPAARVLKTGQTL